ncbi:unnamed protein product [Symbiodinium sp. CCMP2592]|nr:unnamed protein product [Symbiodinium sp. CCMP2592]
MSSLGKKHVQRACSLIKQQLMESCVDSGALALAFDILATIPEEYKSGKWTEERELKRKAHVKPNEALSQEKPRMIITSGDEGVVRHILDSGLLEHALFNNPLFEQRSLKHASRREFGRRMGEMMRCYEHACSMDFGAFDGSCTRECRDLIENDIILSMFMKLMSAEPMDGLIHAAVKDRIKQKANISVKIVVKAVIWDMIRESGDRGTSILNFLTNLTLFYANMAMLLEKRGVKEKVIKKMIMESLKSGNLANLMGEGDDGLHVFKEAFDMNTSFKIELQGPTGDLEFHECVTSTQERLEFCSKIAVAVGSETYYFPKPAKLSNSLTVSFDMGNPRSIAGYTKAVAMMSNCIHQPLLLALCKAIATGHKEDGGTLDVKHLTRLLGPGEEIGEDADYEERLTIETHALERETGITVAYQEDAILALGTGNRDTVTACLKALRG